MHCISTECQKASALHLTKIQHKFIEMEFLVVFNSYMLKEA